MCLNKEKKNEIKGLRMLSLGKMAYFVALLLALLKEIFFWKSSEIFGWFF